MYRDELTDAFLEEAFARAARVRTERLPADDEIPHEFSPRFARRMRAVLREGERPPRVNRVIFLGKRSAAVLVAAAVVAFGAVMSVAAWRKYVLNFVADSYGTQTNIYFRPEDSLVPPGTLERYRPTQYMEGYQLVYSNKTECSYTEYFENAAGEGVYYSQICLEAMDENGHSQTIEGLGSGNQTRTLPDECKYSVTWKNDRYSFLLAADSAQVDLEEQKLSTLSDEEQRPFQEHAVWDGVRLPETLIKFAPTTIPEEYHLVTSYENEYTQNYYFENAEGQGIYFSQMRLDLASIAFSGDLVFKEGALSDGTEVRYIADEGGGIILWQNSMYAFYLNVDSDEIDLFALAESTKMEK